MFNVIRRIQGSCDSPLTENGIAQGRLAGKALSHVHFDKAFCSSSERAVDTAALVLEGRDLKAVPCKGLKEFDFGRLDGEKAADVMDKLRAHAEDMDFREYGGDSRKSMAERIRKTFESIVKECRDGDQVLIVSHGAFAMHMLQSLLGQSDMKQTAERLTLVPNGGIIKFEYLDGAWKLLEGPMAPQEFKDQ